jgi:hypothetical protein
VNARSLRFITSKQAVQSGLVWFVFIFSLFVFDFWTLVFLTHGERQGFSSAPTIPDGTRLGSLLMAPHREDKPGH